MMQPPTGAKNIAGVGAPRGLSSANVGLIKTAIAGRRGRSPVHADTNNPSAALP